MLEQGDAEWQYGMFQCFGDPKLCIITFLLPCYTIGKNAEQMGEDCLPTGLLAMCLPYTPVLRWRLRQERRLKGSMTMDSVCAVFCGCCALVQEARELGWSSGGGKGDAPEQGQDMARQ